MESCSRSLGRYWEPDLYPAIYCVLMTCIAMLGYIPIKLHRGQGPQPFAPYYEQAIKDGSEDRLKVLIPDRLPDGIQKAYENTHS